MAGRRGSLATSSSIQLKSQPCISGEYVGLVFMVGHTGVALVSSIQHENLTHSLHVCCQFISNDFMCTHSKFLELVMVSNQPQRVTSQLHIVEGGGLLWMDERYVHI